MKLLIASRNIHKIRELRSLLQIIAGLDLLSLLDFPRYHPPEEEESACEKNAIVKALHAASTLNIWALADDSGLVVPALHGAPGVLSSCYAGLKATDADNRKKLLEEMSALEDPLRQAYYECWLVLASPLDGAPKEVQQGICQGQILRHERGGQGFGYDPLFLKHGYSKTFGEMGEATKNRISHRRKAFDKLLPTLEAVFVQSNVTYAAPHRK